MMVTIGDIVNTILQMKADQERQMELMNKRFEAIEEAIKERDQNANLEMKKTEENIHEGECSLGHQVKERSEPNGQLEEESMTVEEEQKAERNLEESLKVSESKLESSSNTEHSQLAEESTNDLGKQGRKEQSKTQTTSTKELLFQVEMLKTQQGKMKEEIGQTLTEATETMERMRLDARNKERERVRRIIKTYMPRLSVTPIKVPEGCKEWLNVPPYMPDLVIHGMDDPKILEKMASIERHFICNGLPWEEWALQGWFYFGGDLRYFYDTPSKEPLNKLQFTWEDVIYMVAETCRLPAVDAMQQSTWWNLEPKAGEPVKKFIDRYRQAYFASLEFEWKISVAVRDIFAKLLPHFPMNMISHDFLAMSCASTFFKTLSSSFGSERFPETKGPSLRPSKDRESRNHKHRI